MFEHLNNSFLYRPNMQCSTVQLNQSADKYFHIDL